MTAAKQQKRSSREKMKLSDMFYNRELSWLEFNQRVLEEALDETNPLLERLKFLCIVSSNLDEFYQIRVAGYMQQESHGVSSSGVDGLSPTQVLDKIGEKVHAMVAQQYNCLNKEVLPGLRKEGVRLLRRNELTKDQNEWVRRYYESQVRPVLTPLAVNPSHPFPHLLNKTLNFVVTLEGDSPFRQDNWVAIVQAPRILPRVIRLPDDTRTTDKEGIDFIMLSSVIHKFIDELFPGIDVTGCYQFRVTRNSDLYFDEEETENLLASIEQELRMRDKGAGVRLEVAKGCDPDLLEFLLNQLQLTERELFEVDGPVNLHRLMQVWEGCKIPRLHDEAFKPARSPAFKTEKNVFEVLRRKNVLVHHPYESFSCVVDFLKQAAADPKVLAIKQTLYRTSGDSPIVDALKEAASNNKQVAAIVELKARFDEAANIRWSRQLEEAGVHVVYGIAGMKIHAKMSMVVRSEGKYIRRYVHLGTGNYHPATARLYTDLGFLTSDPDYTEDAANVFNLMTGAGHPVAMRKLLIAPFDLHDKVLEYIEYERQAAKNGKPARIFLKTNSLLEKKIILALYKASQAGVRIDCNVRGICGLKPGIKGLSENITVNSIVGRYLEHSRIFYFNHGGKELVFLGSADLMPRNLFRRIEVTFPVEDATLKRRLTSEIIPAFIHDNVKSRYIQKDGSHQKRKLGPKETPFAAQDYLMKAAYGKGRKQKPPAIKAEEPKPSSSPIPL